MKIIEALDNAMEMVEKKTEHQGYQYRVRDILLTLICGMLCSLQTIEVIYEWCKEEYVHNFLNEQFHGVNIPCRAQFYNILGCVKSEVFNEVFMGWMKTILQANMQGKTIAIDGKAICSSDTFKKDSAESMIHITSAYLSEYGLTIGSVAGTKKTSEINAFRELIQLLDLKGCIVVADALHCNPKTAEAVTKEEADYLFVVKDNQKTLHENIALYVQSEPLESFQTIEKNGGRIEKRTSFVCYDTSWLEDSDKWANLSMIGAIHRETEKNGIKSSEWHYYISSKALTPEQLLTHARAEWGVESMHWLLDVHFSEDKTKVWDGNLQKNLNYMRKTALNFAKMFKMRTNSKLAMSKILKKNLFIYPILPCF